MLCVCQSAPEVTPRVGQGVRFRAVCRYNEMDTLCRRVRRLPVGFRFFAPSRSVGRLRNLELFIVVHADYTEGRDTLSRHGCMALFRMGDRE